MCQGSRRRQWRSCGWGWSVLGRRVKEQKIGEKWDRDGWSICGCTGSIFFDDKTYMDSGKDKFRSMASLEKSASLYMQSVIY